MAAADYRLLTEATGVRIAEALENITAMVGPKGDTGEVSEAELTAKLADKASVIVDTASGAIASFPDGAAVAAKDIVIGIEPVQSGSGDPSPENVRPISGWTGANVSRTGKNLLQGIEEGGINAYGTKVSNDIRVRSINMIELLAGQQYVISSTVSQVAYQIWETNEFGNNVKLFDSGWISIPAIVTPQQHSYLTFVMRRENSEPLSDYATTQVEVGTIATAYEPYTGTTIPISWQSEAGTIYGGTLDVTTGLLTVDRAVSKLNSLAWNMVSGMFYSRTLWSQGVLKPPIAYGQDCMSNQYATSHVLAWSDIPNGSVCVGLMNWSSSASDVVINDNRYNNVTDFINHLTDNDIIVYELATPQTYQLTPTEVTLLLGDNNVWADTGDSTVTYRADTKLYIQKINAPTDDDMIADAQIANGKYFIVGGNLYKSTTTIPAGDTINPGSNCILTNLAEALNALNT